MPNTNEQNTVNLNEGTTSLDNLAQAAANDGAVSENPAPVMPAPAETATTPVLPETGEATIATLESLSQAASQDPVVPEEDTVISRLNSEKIDANLPSQINLENFVVPETKRHDAKITLGESGLVFSAKRRMFTFTYWKMLTTALIAIFIFGLTALTLGLYNKYLSIASQAIIPADKISYVEAHTALHGTLQSTLGISDYQKYTSMTIDAENGRKNIDEILNADFNYVTKKTLIQGAVNNFSIDLIRDKETLESIRQEVTKYGFFSQELYNLLQNEEYVTSIKESLLSLEMIKFSSAMKVFSYLDTFIGTITNVLGIDTIIAYNNMAKLSSRGEKDIALYLNSCYLNPYEIDYDCNLVGDFDRYYSLMSKDESNFDTSFFKKIMALIDLKLEQTALPSFAITFQKFDPTQKQISFKVDVNTFQQDEAALMRKGVINPHIFVITNLLNLIKQSLYVVSESVDAKTLKIIPKTIKIGTTVFTFNNSTLNFVLPIQESTQREISDYTAKDLLPTTQ